MPGRFPAPRGKTGGRASHPKETTTAASNELESFENGQAFFSERVRLGR